MSGTAPAARVLHVNDCAGTTAQLLAEAHRRGLPWGYQPLAGRGRSWSGPAGDLARAAAGARWAAALGARAARADLLHVHYASVVRHTRWTRRPYVLHAHGTDVRTQQYEPRWTAPLRAALREAVAVRYSTPDLAEHVLPHRPDAAYLPVPLDLTALPAWEPAPRPRVVFASRWEAVKGGDEQLAAAAALRAALPGDVELVGLDWGPRAADAAAAGVRLLPRTARPAFLRLLAGATAVVGQASGMLAASELEAVGTGVPVVAALRPDWYPPGAPDAAPAVLAGTTAWSGRAPERVAAVVDGVRSALADPPAVAAALGGPAWLATCHDVAGAVDDLLTTYRRVLG
ncbi:glycosyltransferase family 4 protein [Kineococcus indalonis]|uniref:glycosyltransferase family 4 protein n=1 Tax=Kineococcus indalonis TaxID=2696566 RepID=UPI0014136732|nr:glycosyltransferase family 4 protein [Kineococcus indalonis]NAZ86046.1 hypothetical protein [Kineococcus indalonis]